MNTVGKYLTHASTQLNDQRYGRAFTRWGRGLLLDYMNLGLAEIGTYFPDDFTQEIIVTLKPGREQSIDGVNRIITVSGNEDGSPLTEMDRDLSDSFAIYDICPADISFVNGSPVYKAVSYAVRMENPRAFIVEPAVPQGMAPKVTVSVDGAVPQFTLADWDTAHNIPPKYTNALMDFVLGKAHGLNQESVSSRAESQEHLSRFYSVLGINYKKSAQYGSGYYNGKIGDGDRRTGP
jgi:hypothetical protein